MNSAVMFAKASDEWSTPQDFWNELHAEFDFGVDAAASMENRKCNYFYSQAQDALAADWSALRFDGARPTFWLNCPYSRCREFIAKAAAEARKGCTVVCLIPSRTDTRYWHDFIFDRTTFALRPGVEVRYVKGRLKFGDGKNSAPFPSVVVIFRPPQEL